MFLQEIFEQNKQKLSWVCNVFNLFELRQNYLFEQTKQEEERTLFNVYPECVLYTVVEIHRVLRESHCETKQKNKTSKMKIEQLEQQQQQACRKTRTMAIWEI